LVSTDSHIPLLSHLYPGNQNDAAMFSSITENLVARCKQVAVVCLDEFRKPCLDVIHIPAVVRF